MHNLVELRLVSPRISCEIVYATAHNFTGQIVYPDARCFLIKNTAERLHKVQCNLEKLGMGLKVFDGYRPLSVQKIFWNILPDPRFVADPDMGSKHNRGVAVDLTLVDRKGKELLMPSKFDDFSKKASHFFAGGPKEALLNRDFLKSEMVRGGFIPYSEEWWHYDDPDWERYPILDIPFQEL